VQPKIPLRVRAPQPGKDSCLGKHVHVLLTCNPSIHIPAPFHCETGDNVGYNTYNYAWLAV
jgi:hypothetical protein